MPFRRLKLHHRDSFVIEQYAAIVTGVWARERRSIRISAKAVKVFVEPARQIRAAVEILCPCLFCLRRAAARTGLPISNSRVRIYVDDTELLSDRLTRSKSEPRWVSLHVTGWDRVTPEQAGAIAAHLYRTDNVREVEITRLGVSAAFFDDQLVELRGDINALGALVSELQQLAELDPLICPCGCGVPLILAPCVRDREPTEIDL